MTAYPFTQPTDSPGPRRPGLLPRLVFDLPLQGLGRTSITRAQTPLMSMTEHRKGRA